MMNNLINLISKAFMALLKLDPDTNLRLAELKLKKVAIIILPISITYLCTFDENGIHISSLKPEDTYDVFLTGTPLQFASVMLDKNNRHKFFADDLKIDGDAIVANKVIALFDQLEIDWEEYLANITGDTIAYHALKTFKSFKQALSDAKNTFFDNVSEYIQEEKEWLPNKILLNDFLLEVDVLKMDTDRLEAKIQQIKSITSRNKK